MSYFTSSPSPTSLPPSLSSSPQFDPAAFAATREQTNTQKTVENFAGTKWLSNKITASADWQVTALKIVSMPLWIPALIVTAAFEATIGLGVYALINKYHTPKEEPQTFDQPQTPPTGTEEQNQSITEQQPTLQQGQENPQNPNSLTHSLQQQNTPSINPAQSPSSTRSEIDEYERHLLQFLPEAGAYYSLQAPTNSMYQQPPPQIQQAPPQFQQQQEQQQPREIIDEPPSIDEQPPFIFTNQPLFIPPPPGSSSSTPQTSNRSQNRSSIPNPSTLAIRLNNHTSNTSNDKRWYQSRTAKVGMVALPLIGGAAAAYATGGLSLLSSFLPAFMIF